MSAGGSTLLTASCGTTSLTPYGKFTLVTHHRSLGSSCLSDSHSHLRGPEVDSLPDPLELFEVSGDRLWAVAASGKGAGTLLLLDLEGGRVHSKHDLGMPTRELGEAPFDPLQWSSNRDHLLLERAESPGTLILISFEPTLRVRTLFREEGAIASVRELRRTFWAPDGTGLAFLASPARRSGPTRVFHVRFDSPEGPREIARSDGPPNEISIRWEGSLPRVD